MPVRRFRSIEQMKRPRWYQPGDPALYRAIAMTWELGRRTNSRRFPPGVHKYRSIEEMSATQDRALDQHIAALAESRRSGR
jgi:hypothetical protein